MHSTRLGFVCLVVVSVTLDLQLGHCYMSHDPASLLNDRVVRPTNEMCLFTKTNIIEKLHWLFHQEEVSLVVRSHVYYSVTM